MKMNTEIKNETKGVKQLIPSGNWKTNETRLKEVAKDIKDHPHATIIHWKVGLKPL